MNDQTDDVVGYGRPPKSTRFRKGRSGNPKGKSKNTRNFRADLRAELDEFITIRENGKEQRVTKQRALIKALVAAAIKGDMRAANAIVTLSTKSLAEAENAPDNALPSDDQAILDAFVERELERRLAETNGASSSEPTSSETRQ